MRWTETDALRMIFADPTRTESSSGSTEPSLSSGSVERSKGATAPRSATTAAMSKRRGRSREAIQRFRSHGEGRRVRRQVAEIGERLSKLQAARPARLPTALPVPTPIPTPPVTRSNAAKSDSAVMDENDDDAFSYLARQAPVAASSVMEGPKATVTIPTVIRFPDSGLSDPPVDRVLRYDGELRYTWRFDVITHFLMTPRLFAMAEVEMRANGETERCKELKLVREAREYYCKRERRRIRLIISFPKVPTSKRDPTPAPLVVIADNDTVYCSMCDHGLQPLIVQDTVAQCPHCTVSYWCKTCESHRQNRILAYQHEPNSDACQEITERIGQNITSHMIGLPRCCFQCLKPELFIQRALDFLLRETAISTFKRCFNITPAYAATTAAAVDPAPERPPAQQQQSDLGTLPSPTAAIPAETADALTAVAKAPNLSRGAEAPTATDAIGLLAASARTAAATALSTPNLATTPAVCATQRGRTDQSADAALSLARHTPAEDGLGLNTNIMTTWSGKDALNNEAGNQRPSNASKILQLSGKLNLSFRTFVDGSRLNQPPSLIEVMGRQIQNAVFANGIDLFVNHVLGYVGPVLFGCFRCNTVLYCSLACLRADRDLHKLECDQIRTPNCIDTSSRIAR
jgi:hypothetical protein